jgi:hypothetical protein
MGMRTTGVATRKGRARGFGGIPGKVLWILVAREQAVRLALLVPLVAGVAVGEEEEEEEEEVAGLWRGQPCATHTVVDVDTTQVNPPHLVWGPEAAVVGSVGCRSRSQVFTQVFTQVCNALPYISLAIH